jgi:hypothetical protein
LIEVCFNFSLLHDATFTAEAAFERDAGRSHMLRRRKFNLPKINLGIAESDPVNIAARVLAKMADEPDVRLAAGIGTP